MAKKANLTSLTDSLEDAFSHFEHDRLEALRGLREIQVLSQSMLQREAKRLSRKLGAEHPRVRQLEAQLEHNCRLVQELEVELEVASIQTPRVEEDEALIHGRVTDEHRRGIAGLIVHAQDESGQELQFLGSAETDDVGYYALRIDPVAVERLAEEAVGKIDLVVGTKAGEVVHREPVPLKPGKGERIIASVALQPEETGPEKWQPAEQRDEAADIWTARGRVTDEEGRGLAGLLVRAFDKDRRYDDKLGSTLTDGNGEFSISYRVQDFREGQEPGPDLYLTVMDQEGKTLYVSEGSVRLDAGRVEVFNIVIERRQRGKE